MATLGLAVITNELDETKKLIETYYPYFDKFFITVADKDKTVYDELSKLDNDKVELSYFEWVDHFGKARIFNQEQVTTDFWFWCDMDDEITNPENLRQTVSDMERDHVDIMFMNYDYYQNDQGEQQANHWRERIIRTDSDCRWESVPCHETIPAKGIAGNTQQCQVRHHKPLDLMLRSMDRNQVLLEKDWAINKDPRTAYYLGMTYQYHQQFDEAIKMFTFMIDNGGWDEQKIAALNMIAQCYFAQADYEKALDACDKALRLDPSHPDAYYHKVMIYANTQQYDKAVQWADIAVTKNVNPNSMQLIDPTKYTYKGLFLAAQANLLLGQTEKAYEFYNKVASIAPQFIQQISAETGVDWASTFPQAYNEAKAVNDVKELAAYIKDTGGKLDKLFQALPPKMFMDNRLLPERQMAIPPKKWPEKSIVIYCGAGFEPWGPDTLDKGMGGSEEAVVYLSRELAKLSWRVTIFCERENSYEDEWAYGDHMLCVDYKPWSEFTPYDEFDVFIAWRQPVFLQGINARKKIVDLHDVMPEEALLPVLDQVDMYMVKSPYHRSLYPNVPDEKISIVTNGIYKNLAYS